MKQFTGINTSTAYQYHWVTVTPSASESSHVAELQFYEGSSSSSSPGGADTNVQFNDGGSLGGDAKFHWNKTTSKLTVTGNIDYTGVMTDTSDARMKDDIAALEGDLLAKVRALKPVSFVMKNDANRVTEFGFLAQDVRPIFPELVNEADDEDKTLSMNYMGMVPVLAGAIKELSATVDALAAQNKALQAEIEAIKAERDSQKE